MKLRKPASNGLSVKTRTLKLLVENVSEHLFDFKARRSVKDADLNGGRSTGHCYSVVAEKNLTGVVVHPFTPCIWKVEDSGGSLESRSCELAW